MATLSALLRGRGTGAIAHQPPDWLLATVTSPACSSSGWPVPLRPIGGTHGWVSRGRPPDGSRAGPASGSGGVLCVDILRILPAELDPGRGGTGLTDSREPAGTRRLAPSPRSRSASPPVIGGHSIWTPTTPPKSPRVSPPMVLTRALRSLSFPLCTSVGQPTRRASLPAPFRPRGLLPKRTASAPTRSLTSHE
jgi:hypothetical protein